MDFRVPDEVEMQSPVEVLAIAVAISPHPHSFPVERLQEGVLCPLLAGIPFGEIPISLANLEAHLHAHRALRQGPDQRFEGFLCPVAGVVIMVESVEANGLVARNEAAIGPNHYIVEIVPDRQQLAECRLS
jgi:hypothetical protein